LMLVREKAVECKRHLFDKELMYIYYQKMQGMGK
jgi:hypothetical protein